MEYDLWPAFTNHGLLAVEPPKGEHKEVPLPYTCQVYRPSTESYLTALVVLSFWITSPKCTQLSLFPLPQVIPQALLEEGIADGMYLFLSTVVAKKLGRFWQDDAPNTIEDPIYSKNPEEAVALCAKKILGDVFIFTALSLPFSMSRPFHLPIRSIEFIKSAIFVEYMTQGLLQVKDTCLVEEQKFRGESPPSLRVPGSAARSMIPSFTPQDPAFDFCLSTLLRTTVYHLLGDGVPGVFRLFTYGFSEWKILNFFASALITSVSESYLCQNVIPLQLHYPKRAVIHSAAAVSLLALSYRRSIMNDTFTRQAALAILTEMIVASVKEVCHDANHYEN